MKSSYFSLRSLVLATALTSIFAACGSDQSAASEQPEASVEAQTPSTPEQEETGGELPAISAETDYVDPVCKMKVTDATPYRHTHNGLTYGLCSPSCQERLSSEPTAYIE